MYIRWITLTLLTSLALTFFGCGRDDDQKSSKQSDAQETKNVAPQKLILFIDASESMRGYVNPESSEFRDILKEFFHTSNAKGCELTVYHWGIRKGGPDKNELTPVKEIAVSTPENYNRVGNRYGAIFREAVAMQAKEPDACVIVLSDGIFSPLKNVGGNDEEERLIDSVLTAYSKNKGAFHLYAYKSKFKGTYFYKQAGSNGEQKIQIDTVRNFYAFGFSEAKYQTFLHEILGKQTFLRQSFGADNQVHFGKRGTGKIIDGKISFDVSGTWFALGDRATFEQSLEISDKNRWTPAYTPDGDAGVLTLTHSKLKTKEGKVSISVRNPLAPLWHNLSLTDVEENPKTLDHTRTWRFFIIQKAIERAYQEDVAGKTEFIAKD